MSVPRGPRDTRSARIPAAQDADAKDDNGTPTASLHLLTQRFPASPPPRHFAQEWPKAHSLATGVRRGRGRLRWWVTRRIRPPEASPGDPSIPCPS